MSEFDAIVVGGGHNGLTAAAYLCKAGLKTLVLERNDYFGGGLLTREVTLPGFKHDLFSTSHAAIQPNPLIAKDELGLISKYGLRYVYPDALIGAPFPDGSSIVIDRDLQKTHKSLAKISKRDADAYIKLFKWSELVMERWVPLTMDAPPTFGELFSELEKDEEGREIMRTMMMSGMKVVEEWFEDDRIKALLGKYSTEQSAAHPDENGTGLFIPIMINRAKVYRYAAPIGGSQELAKTLARYIENHDGTLQSKTEVKEIIVKDGVARGVRLADGGTMLARKAVVADVHAKQLLDLVGEEDLGEYFSKAVRRFKPNNVSAVCIHLALSEAPNYGNADLNKVWTVEHVTTVKHLLKHFDDIRDGATPTRRNQAPIFKVQTIYDPSRAPPGKHTGYLYSFVPFELESGGVSAWKEAKEQVADELVALVGEAASNVNKKTILGRYVVSPIEITSTNISFYAGNISHIAVTLHQMMSFRPVPGWGNYRTPVRNLYFAGPSTPTGGGVTGGGRTVAKVVLTDLGLPFDAS